MEEEIAAAAARAVDELATHLPRLVFQSAASRCWKLLFAPYSSSAPNCNIDKVQQGIKMLGKTLVRIRARLNDAEHMEMPDESIRLWLNQLGGVAYDAKDVLDDFFCDVRCLQLLLGGFAQVSYPSSATRSYDLVAYLNRVQNRIETINSRFERIAKHRESLQFPESYAQRNREVPVHQPTSSMIEQSCIFGRDEDFKKVNKFLLSDEESSGGNNSVTVMAIVGMGGLGKTTLAQLAYNDDEVNKHFPLKSWICASQDPDLVQLTRAMVEAFDQQGRDISSIDLLQLKLKERLNGRRFLLVLDDVWEQTNLGDLWGRLQLPLLSGSRGIPASLGLEGLHTASSKDRLHRLATGGSGFDAAFGGLASFTTTRSVKVSRIMSAVSTYHLPSLKDEDCLKLFNRLAFQGRDHSFPSTMMDAARKISVKCKGLPLVAMTLGGLLRSEDDEHVWNDVLESDVWKISEVSGIMPVLRLSYQHLPAHLKRCFRYCSLFPKGYQFDKDRLVWMWMAHGYVRPENGRLVEEIGDKYFNDLLCRSFFQNSESPKIYLMHDLIHDLGTWVSRGEFCCVEGGNNYSGSISGDVRHISIASHIDLSSMTSSGDISGLGMLRSVLNVSRSFRWIYPPKLEDELFVRMKHLRVLDLSFSGMQSLSHSICYLRHLRYLILRGNPIKSLPNSVGHLYLLETLDVQCSRCSGLPYQISNLRNLRHLHVGTKNSSSECIRFPVGIGKLSNLQTMPGFLAWQLHGNAKLGELGNLNNLRSLFVDISGTDVNEAEKACLHRKENMRSLGLRWARWTDPSPLDGDVLGRLRPSGNKLEELSISYFMGQSPPSWLGHPSFSRLATIKLYGCDNWTSLPPLGQLPCLRRLFIWSARRVECIGHGFFSGGFPRLETLKLHGMNSWKSWCGAQAGECPHLREICIFSCRNLASLSVSSLVSLQDLQIEDCPALKFSPDSLQLGQVHSLRRVCMSQVLGAKYVGPGFFHGDSLERVTLVKVHQWVSWRGPADGECPRLRSLRVENCPNLVSLHLGNLNALERLHVRGCPRLSIADPLPPALQDLTIDGSHMGLSGGAAASKA